MKMTEKKYRNYLKSDEWLTIEADRIGEEILEAFKCIVIDDIESFTSSTNFIKPDEIVQPSIRKMQEKDELLVRADFNYPSIGKFSVIYPAEYLWVSSDLLQVSKFKEDKKNKRIMIIKGEDLEQAAFDRHVEAVLDKYRPAAKKEKA